MAREYIDELGDGTINPETSGVDSQATDNGTHVKTLAPIYYTPATIANDGKATRETPVTIKSALDGKQNTLATQTAYSAKGTATKVPQITTNALGQVTNIEEVDIGYSNSTDLVVSNENNSTPFLLYEISNVGLTQSYTTAVTELMVYLVRSSASTPEAATANHMSFKVSIHWQWSLVRTNIEGSLPFGTVTAVLVNSATPTAGSDVSTLKIYLTPENYVSYRVAVTDNRIRGNGNLVRGTITKRGVREAIPTASALVIVGTTNVMTMQTKENLITTWNSTPSDTVYPSEKLVKGSLDAKAPNAVTTEAAIATGDKLLFSDANDSSKTKRMSTGFDTTVSDTFLCRNGNFATVKEADVRWGGSFRQELSPIEFGNMCRNVIHNPPPAAIKFEKTTNGGTTWTEQTVTDNAKMQLCNLTLGSNFSIANSEYASISSPNMLKARITLTAMSNFTVTAYSNTWFYAQCKRIVVYCSKSGNSQMKIETQSGPDFIAHNDTWTDRGTYAIAGDGGWNSIPFDMVVGGFTDQLSGRIVAIRFTYWIESGSAPRISISRIGIIPQIHWSTRAGNIPFLGVPIGIENNGDGTIAKASKLSNARELSVDLSSTSTTATSFDGTANVSIKNTGTLPVSKGGTGKTTAPAAEYNILSNARTEITTYDDDSRFLCESTGPSEQVGIISGFRKASTIWNYIMGKISSVLGLTATNYGGTADTATKVSGTQVGQDSNARHLWFSTTVETQRGYIDSLTYRTDTNTISANISGNATTATTATNYNTSSGNIKTALDGKSSTSHTHSVSINGSTKTIAASGGTAVDLGTYKVFNYAKVYTTQTYNENTNRYILLALKSTTYTGNWEESSMFKLVVHDGQVPKELVFRLWLNGLISDNVVPPDPANPKLYRVYSENFSTNLEFALKLLDVRLFVVRKSAASITFTIGIFIDRNYLQARWVSYQLYPLSYGTSDRGNTIDNGLTSWTYTVGQDVYSDLHGLFTTAFDANDLTVDMNAASATAFNIASATTGNVVDTALYKIPLLDDNAAGRWTGTPSNSTGTQQRLLYNPNNNTINANITGDAQSVRGFYITKTIVNDSNAIIFF